MSTQQSMKSRRTSSPTPPPCPNDPSAHTAPPPSSCGTSAPGRHYTSLLGCSNLLPANDEAVTEAYRPRQDIWTSSRAWWMSPPTEEENGGREQYKEDDEEFMELCRKWKEEHEPR
ncbi:hypothetical protein QFC20_003803 [Naganishia adeliensis]|uniref:Uncharacterized protein n=1 Tax=Naganishia adeliensis TaxID=92952 RepID=A0ACC2W5S2_9TREE|nr:hypothetical protein QFC20_003803 [Naganishia adeliensis]